MMDLDIKLSNMKKKRKDVESKAKMLNNRVNMLKNQERKNLRKIEGGKKLVIKFFICNKWQIKT